MSGTIDLIARTVSFLQSAGFAAMEGSSSKTCISDLNVAVQDRRFI